jgi:hypothetical protein
MHVNEDIIVVLDETAAKRSRSRSRPPRRRPGVRTTGVAKTLNQAHIEGKKGSSGGRSTPSSQKKPRLAFLENVDRLGSRRPSAAATAIISRASPGPDLSQSGGS